MGANYQSAPRNDLSNACASFAIARFSQKPQQIHLDKSCFARFSQIE
jgi:hypothetical protein